MKKADRVKRAEKRQRVFDKAVKEGVPAQEVYRRLQKAGVGMRHQKVQELYRIATGRTKKLYVAKNIPRRYRSKAVKLVRIYGVSAWSDDEYQVYDLQYYLDKKYADNDIIAFLLAQFPVVERGGFEKAEIFRLNPNVDRIGVAEMRVGRTAKVWKLKGDFRDRVKKDIEGSQSFKRDKLNESIKKRKRHRGSPYGKKLKELEKYDK